MICATATVDGAGLLELTQVDCNATTTALVLQEQTELGGSFFNIPLSAAPELLLASLSLIAVAYGIRKSRQALD